MKFFIASALFAAIASSTSSAASSSSSSLSKSLFGIGTASRSQRSLISSIIPRGGGTDDANDNSNSDDADQQQQESPAYHPGLLNAIITSSSSDVTASSDYTLSISPSKAKELQLKSGDLVAIIGKRRRATYAKVNISKGSSNEDAIVSRNLATNLRLRTMDKVKIVPLTEQEDEECESKSYNLGNKPTSSTIASSITFHPLKDSLTSLDYKEGGGGDGLSDEEVMERFITPYLNLEDDGDEIFVNGGHMLTLKDENGFLLEFKVGHMDLGDEEEGALVVVEFRQCWHPLSFTVSLMRVPFSSTDISSPSRLALYLSSRNDIRRLFHHLGNYQLLHQNYHRTTRRSGGSRPWLRFRRWLFQGH